MAKAKPMTKSDAARIQSGAARTNDGVVPKGSFAARAQSAADKSASASRGPGGKPSKKTGRKSGKRRDNNPPKQ